MENQSTLDENGQNRNKWHIFIKITLFVWTPFITIVNILLLFKNPNILFSDDYIYYISIIFLTIWGPLLIIIAGVSYITKMANISNIPTNSSIYDAITLPTIQYGPLKVILPLLEEEDIFIENEDI